MIPPIELREQAAKLHEEMTKAEDILRDAADNGRDHIYEFEDYARAEWELNVFTLEHEFHLLTDASGLHLRCAETGIPLVETDECVETETGEVRIVKEAA